ncbi:hypothetical protein F4780DRAFT_790947 [Xylariomycetidae sp. FL0641]|nr:hypothetical protein F4780DRAFT_790947 [Xylariomycetidae sp. FL0641]
MPELYLLPSSTYRPPSPSLGRRPGRSLNTIMEEEGEQTQLSQKSVPDSRRMQARPSNEKIVQWLSPRSDHFPTPRGFHFLSAPILPESPSTAASFDESNSPSTQSSNPWNRTSVSTDVTEFDDIYDISDDEDSRPKPARTSSLKRQSSTRATMPRRPGAADSSASHRVLPPLVIPPQNDQDAESWSGRPDLKKLMSPVPPTPPAKVEMSPAVISFLQSQQSHEVPTISAPPSLDGSLSSDQMATMSAPPTPVMGANDKPNHQDWSGVQLQPGALATLHALSGSDVTDDDYQPNQVIEVQGRTPEMSQQAPLVFSPVRRPALRLSTGQRQPLTGLTPLDIPSPGGFFSGLTPRSRHTWHMPSMTPDDIAPPTSTTAEQFYRCPWNEPAPPVPSLSNIPPPPPRPAHFSNIPHPPAPIEQVVEVRGTMSDGIPTARPVILEQIVEANQARAEDPLTARRIEPPALSPVQEVVSPTEDVIADEMVTVYDPEYAQKQQNAALSNLDRTELWLKAQKAYLKDLYTEEESTEDESESETIDTKPEEEPEAQEAKEEVALPQRKKTVRFSEPVKKTDIPRSLPAQFLRQESAYYRAFQHHVIHSRSQDTFVHRLPRFEALQAQRISLREAHRNQLLGKYQLSVVPQSARKRMSANVVRGDDVLLDDPEKLRREKEHEAQTQMALANWHVAAIKMLNGGRLFSAPVAKRLARLSLAPGSTSRPRVRVLDLGGMPTGDWAWHCALAFPAAKVYTTTTKALRQLSNCNVRGPPNHRPVAVERLTRLPFPDGHFDLVSARELHSILKFIGENGEDEWEGCLREVLRVLKPGGYLDFRVLDADVVNAGPLALAKSVEFGFALKTLGYDPSPSRMFLARLGRAGFEDVRRAWTCLPMGAAPATDRPLPAIPRESTGEVPQTLTLEAMVQGSTRAAADVAGLAGGWAWERWLLRAEAERAASQGHSFFAFDAAASQSCLDGVHAVVEEGRRCGAAWRVLQGFARKPVPMPTKGARKL